MRKMEHAMYFAYGSNMNLDQMAYRCPAAEAVCTAKLEGYELFFAGRPGNGVASIRPKQGGTVVGMLWKLTEACEKSLDHYEGFPALYGKETVRVRGSDGTEHRVTAYTMQEPYSRIPAMPSMGYLAGILAGCEQNGIDEKTILRAVLATLEDKLYKPTAVPADAEKIEKYIETKVDGNLKKLHEDRMLRELMSYDTLRINGVEYKNLPALDWMFDHDRLRNLFAKDPVGTIHGDLTIENIICRTDNDSWYLIDPNTGNLHESPFLDYGKLLQSLHGSYEFMMKTPRVAVQDNRIDFQLTRSAAYDALLAAVMEDLSARYPREQVESILMHEVIHWLRLMPYKLNKDRKRAAMFYAGLVMVANDVADFSEHKKETLC